jgi:L-aminopeptidase/D-esterase-like protein
MKTINRNDPLETVNIYDLEDFRIGHEADGENITGCTAIICTNTEHLTAGADVRGGAPGTRNLDIIQPMNCFDACQAVVLSGGSLFGLGASSGVEKYMEEQGIGLPFVNVTLPVVCQAILFDLAIGSKDVRPDADMGYRAAANAFMGFKYRDGNVGAGMGATVGKIGSPAWMMKSGLGTYCYKRGDLYVGAVMAVNAIGDVVDPDTHEIVAGALNDSGTGFRDTERFLAENLTTEDFFMGNTTIGAIITNARLSCPQAHKIAAWSQDGIARAVRPAHSMSDGDTMFCMASGCVDVAMNVVGTLAVMAVERAIVSAVTHAESLGGFRSRKEIFGT